jgi:hypothetical protein
MPELDDPETQPGELTQPLSLSMEIEFFSAAREMDRWTRVGLYGFVLNGYLLTFFGTLLLMVELTTGPRGMSTQEYVALAAAVFVCAHLVLEARSTKQLTVARWSVFAACIFELAWSTWANIRDPMGRRVFLCVIIVGGLSMLGARLLVEYRHQLKTASLARRASIGLLGWFGLLIAVGIWFL